MKKSWKRILAAALAACMIFCDSSLVYAAESQPIEETSEIETSEIESEELDEESVSETVEVTEVEEETATEEENSEEVVVESLEITEVSSVIEMNSAVDGTTITELTVGQDVLVSGGEAGTTLSKWYDFVPSESGYYRLVSDTFKSGAIGVKENASDNYVYNSKMDYIYILKADASYLQDVEKISYFESGKMYSIYISGTVAAGESATFVWSEYPEDDTVPVLEMNQSVEVTGGQVSLYKIYAEETTTGLLRLNEYGAGIAVHGNSYWGLNSSDTSGTDQILVVPGGTKYYIAVAPNQTTTLQWTQVESEEFAVGETKTITNDTGSVKKCYEFVPESENVYLLKCDTDDLRWAAIGNDGTFVKTGSYFKSNSNYSGDTYVDADETTWMKISDLQDVEKVVVLTLLKESASGTVTLKEYTEGESSIVDGTILEELTVDQEVTITSEEGEGGSYDIHYAFTAEESGYYYLESDVFEERGYYTWSETEQAYSERQELPMRCVLKENASSIYTDVIISHYFEAGTKYYVNVNGYVAGGTSETFTWRKCTGTENVQEITLCAEAITKTAPAGEISIYKVNPSETTIASVLVDGTREVRIYGDTYVGLEESRCYDDVEFIEQVMGFIKDDTYYFVVKPEKDATITFNVETLKGINARDIITETIPEEDDYDYICYEFIADKETEYELYMSSENRAAIAVDENGEVVDESKWEQLTGVDGNLWYKIPAMKDVAKIYLFMKVCGYAEETIILRKASDEQVILTAWDDENTKIDVPANSIVEVTYTGPNYGDFFIKPNSALKVTSDTCDIKTYCYYMELVSVIEVASDWDLSRNDSVSFTFRLENTTEEDTSVGVFHEANTYSELGSGEEFRFWDIYETDPEADDPYAYNEEQIGYFKFAPQTTAIYQHKDIEWIMKQQGDGWVREQSFDEISEAAVLRDDTTYLLKFKSEKHADMDPIKEYIYDYVGGAASLTYNREDDENPARCFYPTENAIYSTKRWMNGVTLWGWDNDAWSWKLVDKDKIGSENRDEYQLEEYQDYIVLFNHRDTLGIKNDVTVLDYEYYQALTTSGGSISVDANGNVTINPGNPDEEGNIFTFAGKVLSLFGLYHYADNEEYKEPFKETNLYWEGFVPKKLYRYSDGELIETDGSEIEDKDVVVVKYEPEIVWVDRLEVFTDTTTLGVGESTQIYYNQHYATEKYFPSEVPVITYKSSNPNIVDVDENGLLTARAAGKAKISVIADEEKRYEENCEELMVKETIEITVSPKYNIIYKNVDGPEGYVTDENPTEYYKASAMPLTNPEANEGYEFVGWYSDANMTKKITSIAKGSTGDKTVYAKWKPRDYYLIYDLAGGQFAGSCPATFTMNESVVLPTPIRHGYKFVGWYYLEEYTYPDEILEEDLILLPYDNEINAYRTIAGWKDDKQIIAKWEWDTTFSLKVNADQGTYVFPYNTATGTWDSVPISLSIESNPSGIIVNKDYYSTDSGDEYNSLEINLYRLDNGEEYYIATYYNTLELDAGYFNEPGDYRVKATYVHPGQEPQDISAGITIEYEKREYPVQENIEWTRLSNVEEAKTFGDIKIALAESMQVQEAPRSVGGSTIREDLGEERFEIKKETDTEPVEGNLVITKDNIVIKNSKNKVVSDSAKIVSGTYTVTLNFGENDRFFNTASSTLKLTYSAVKAAGVDYTALEPSAEDSTKKTDTEGRTAGSTIAYEVALEEFATPMNTTPYTTGVVITPEISTPWGDYKADEVVAVLNENLLSGDDPNETYSVEVYAEEVTSKSKPALLNIVATEVDLDTNEPINIRKCVEVTANGTAAGKRNLTITTVIKNEMGEEVERLVSTIKNFTVVNGGANAVKSIDLSVDGIVGKVTTDDTGAVTYLIAKESAARTYNVTWSAKNYEETEIADAAKLTWKSSNSKLVSVKAAKDGTVTVTIPKNAQGVADITATAKDAGKKSQTIKFVIVDTSMRLDTTTVTLNSLFESDNIEYVNLYPNILATKLGDQTVDVLFTNAEIGIYEKVKDGKTYKYQESSIFEVINYDSHTGQLEVKAVTPQTKAKTHTVYIGVKHDLSEETEYHAIKIKDVCALPKKPSISLTKSYETVYEGGYEEITLKTKCEVAVVAKGNGDYKYDVEVIDDRFEIISIDDMLFDGEAKNLKIKVDVKEGALPTGKSTSKTTKNVKFAIGYNGYQVKQTATVNITATKNLPKLTVYGEDAYAPVYYTDANLRRVDVVIPVTEALIAGYISESEEPVALGLENDETSAWLTEEGSSEELLNITLKDSSKFSILNAMLVNDYSKFTGEVIPAKKGTLDVEEAIVLTVEVKQNQKKNVSLQFAVDSANLKDRSEPISTSKLTIKAAKVASESIKVANSNGNVVKSLTFNSTLAGKESIDLQIVKSNNIMNVLSQDMNGDYADSYLIVEGSDTNGKKMLQTNALLVNEDQETGTITITTTDNSFNYKSCKLKVTMLVIGDYAVRTKSATLTLNFKKALTPKVTLTNTKWIRGLFEGPAGYENASVIVKAKISNMPVGAEITNVRFADPADYSKYDIVDFDVQSGTCYLIPRVDAKIPVGKDKIDMVYDICTASGDVLTVNTSFTLTVSESISMKVNEMSINLYNSAAGDRYGK